MSKVTHLSVPIHLSASQPYPLPISAFSGDFSLFGDDDDSSEGISTGLALPPSPGYVDPNALKSIVPSSFEELSALGLGFPPAPRLGGLDSNMSQLITPQSDILQPHDNNSLPLCAVAEEENKEAELEDSAGSLFGNEDIFEVANTILSQTSVPSAPVLSMDMFSATDTETQRELRWPPMPAKGESERDAYIETIHFYVFNLGVWDEEHPLFYQKLRKDGGVKRPMNDFPLYRRVWDGTVRLELKKKLGDIPIKTEWVSKEIKANWEALLPHYKKMYQELTAKYHELFKAKNPGYQFDGAGSRAKRGLSPKKSHDKSPPSARGTGNALAVQSNVNANAGVRSPQAQNVAYGAPPPGWHWELQNVDPQTNVPVQMTAPSTVNFATLGQLYPQFQHLQFPPPELQQAQFKSQLDYQRYYLNQYQLGIQDFHQNISTGQPIQVGQ